MEFPRAAARSDAARIGAWGVDGDVGIAIVADVTRVVELALRAPV